MSLCRIASVALCMVFVSNTAFAQQPNKLLIRTLVEVKQLRAEVTRLEEQNTYLQQELDQTIKTAKRSQPVDNKRFQQELERLQLELTQSSKENRQLRQQVERLKTDNSELKTRASKPSKTPSPSLVDQKIMDNLMEENNKLKKEMSALNKQSASRDSQPSRDSNVSEKKLQDMQQQVRSASEERDQLKERVVALNMRMETLKKKNTNLQNEVKTSQSKATLKPNAKQAEVERINADQAERLLALEAKLAQAQKENTGMSALTKTHQQQMTKMRGEHDRRVKTIEQQLAQAMRQIQALEAAQADAQKPASQAKPTATAKEQAKPTPKPKEQAKAKPTPPPATKSKPPSSSLKERAAYNSAMLAFNSKPAEQGRAELGKFVEAYSKSHYSGEANFWIAESYYREKKYAQAQKHYQRIAKDFPKSNKYNDARLKLAYTYYDLKEIQRAKDLLKLLMQVESKRIKSLAKKRLEKIERENK
ncbi:MAG: tetratricopeptide repeat protein [Candidatus Oxydemutatoraceae bacterium WSBS_2016_MAG_OTU14]